MFNFNSVLNEKLHFFNEKLNIPKIRHVLKTKCSCTEWDFNAEQINTVLMDYSNSHNLG